MVLLTDQGIATRIEAFVEPDLKAVAEVRASLSGTDNEVIADKLAALSKAMQEVGQAVYGAQQAANAPGGGGESQPGGDAEGETIEGEFREV